MVNTTRQIMTDTVIQPFNPSDTILTVLKNIQDSVADQRRQLDAQLAVKAGSLRYNNSVLTRRINQMLRDIEQEEIDASMNRVEQRQRLLRETSRLMGFIAIAASLIAILFLFFILRDLSRSQYYRKQLEKAKKYAEDLLHSREKLMLTISHDIRAPLSSIIGYIELMENLGAGERQRYYLENMTGSANHILALMNDLLDFHRLESNQMEIKPVPFNIPMLFGEIYNSFRPIAENKGLDFVLNLREEYTKVQYMGDPIRIRQVVNNLLSNAIKFTPTGKVELLVSVGDKKDTSAVLSFSIVDAGPGIPWDEQEKIFGEFTRLTSTEGVEGFGLGLSITRKLIALMGGSLSLQSIPQKGSTFSVSLPLSVSDVRMTPHPVPEQAGKQYPVREIHCLLVDDDPLQLAMTEEMLSLNHIRVSCCTNPHDVLKRLQELPVDVVITDIQMPGMDGFLLLQQIRQSSVPNAATLPVIALSANLSKEDDHYISAGFTAFLNKPFTGKQLLNLINTLLYRETGEVKELNFSALTAFASDDAEASAHILSTFCRETRKNLALLQEALAGQNRELAAQTSHRLLPLFSMLKEADLSENLRVLEKQSNTLPDLEWRELIDSICARILFVVEHVESNNVE